MKTFNALTLLCPLCRVPLDDSIATRCVCPRCARSFPIFHGIPDLRSEPDEYSGEELATLLARFDESSLEDLIRLRLSFNQMPADVADLHLKHELVGNERGAERTEQIVRFAGDAVDFSGIALDIGCGMGGMVHALAQRFAWAVGIDVALPDLIIAQKRCQEAGLDNVTFICASAEALPFADGTFAMMNATDVVEHVPQQRLFLSEGYRVLQPGGYFCFNSPNRYNIFGPEPHVNLWGVGFLPRAWMPAYVKLFKGMGYTGKRLLSYLELRAMLHQTLGADKARNGTASGPSFQILGTAIRASSARKGWKHRLAFRYPFLVDLANRFLKPFVPQYEVVVSKPR
ncbi:MAG: methyltransferase domain-containing protein [Abditibacteriales bacterium]|nr:methyltransferase domain-containing protein [Abditibacteriales bacterium]MDW8365688.1 methyltransferase domain-containing protein [Abditibacteriales bacterium]